MIKGYSDGGWVESTGWGLLMQVIWNVLYENGSCGFYFIT